MKLYPGSLYELGVWMAEDLEKRKRVARMYDETLPGWREAVATLKKDGGVRLKALMASELAEVAKVYGSIPSNDTRPPVEFPDAHRLEWHPFLGYGRYSPNGRWHLAWGKRFNEDYRVALSFDGALFLWCSPSPRVIDGWVTDSGAFSLQFWLGSDRLGLVLFDAKGSELGQWESDACFKQVFRMDADGRGFAYSDRDEICAVRFDG